jgi:hypothetical protein
VIVGVLVTGDNSVRAAHSLAAHPTVDEVVVIGPARSKSFRVVESAESCDFLLGSGPDAPKHARALGVPLLWDGDTGVKGVAVWGANVRGLTLAIAAREPDPRLVAVAHPDLDSGDDHIARFPNPIGRLHTADTNYGGHQLAVAQSPNEFAAALAIGASRMVTIVDNAAFVSGIALAAAVAVPGEGPRPVWSEALAYLQAATEMGLVMAEDFPQQEN